MLPRWLETVSNTLSSSPVASIWFLQLLLGARHRVQRLLLEGDQKDLRNVLATLATTALQVGW